MARFIFVGIVLATCLRSSLAADWPTWRADAARSGYTVDKLPTKMSLTWTWRPTHPPQPAWPRDERMAFDSESSALFATDVASGDQCVGRLLVQLPESVVGGAAGSQ